MAQIFDLDLSETENYYFESYDDEYCQNINIQSMNYSEFTNEFAQEIFTLTSHKKDIFSKVQVIEPSEYIQKTVKRGLKMPLINEKVRSEVLISPLLLEIKELNDAKISLFSGASLNIDKEKRLVGRCDFILSGEPKTELVTAPFFTLVEAKHQNIEGAYGQAMAQMVACQIFNEQKKRAIPTIYGCITSGEIWQFVSLSQQDFMIDQERYFLKYDLGKIMGIFQKIIDF